MVAEALSEPVQAICEAVMVALEATPRIWPPTSSIAA